MPGATVSRPSPRTKWRALSIMVMPTARAGGWSRHSAKPACSRRRWSQRRRPLRRARSLPRPRDARLSSTASPTSPLRMQGLGSGPVSLFGTAEQRRRWLPDVAAGKAIAAFALSEPESGSDVAAIRHVGRARRQCAMCGSTARRRSSPTAASPTSMWCSPAAARRPARKGLSAFMVEAGRAGVHHRRAHRDGGAASAGAPPFRRLPRAGQPPHRQAGRGVQGRHGDARRVPLDRRRGGARLRPPGLRRVADAMQRRERCSPARSPTCR